MPLHRELRPTNADRRKLEIMADHMGYTPQAMLGIVIDRYYRDLLVDMGLEDTLEQETPPSVSLDDELPF